MRWALTTVCALFLACPVGLGERCSADGDCPSPLVCNEVDPAEPAGLCDYPPLAEGDPCTRAAECAQPLTCSNHFVAGERYGSCVAPHTAGGECLIDRDCESGTCTGATDAALGVCD